MLMQKFEVMKQAQGQLLLDFIMELKKKAMRCGVDVDSSAFQAQLLRGMIDRVLADQVLEQSLSTEDTQSRRSKRGQGTEENSCANVRRSERSHLEISREK